MGLTAKNKTKNLLSSQDALNIVHAVWNICILNQRKRYSSYSGLGGSCCFWNNFPFKPSNKWQLWSRKRKHTAPEARAQAPKGQDFGIKGIRVRTCPGGDPSLCPGWTPPAKSPSGRGWEQYNAAGQRSPVVPNRSPSLVKIPVGFLGSLASD